jgi:hypothetical protein
MREAILLEEMSDTDSLGSGQPEVKFFPAAVVVQLSAQSFNLEPAATLTTR